LTTDCRNATRRPGDRQGPASVYKDRPASTDTPVRAIKAQGLGALGSALDGGSLGEDGCRPRIMRDLYRHPERLADHAVTQAGRASTKSGPESPARSDSQSSGFEDCHDFHRTRIHDYDLVADHEIIVSAPCRLDGEDRLGNRNEVNRTRHRPSNCHVKIDLIDPRCVPLTCKDRMEASRAKC
jgi:hypothetical protein